MNKWKIKKPFSLHYSLFSVKATQKIAIYHRMDWVDQATPIESVLAGKVEVDTISTLYAAG